MGREGSVVYEKASGPNFERIRRGLEVTQGHLVEKIELEYITGSYLVGWLTSVTFFFLSP